MCVSSGSFVYFFPCFLTLTILLLKSSRDFADCVTFMDKSIPSPKPELYRCRNSHLPPSIVGLKVVPEQLKIPKTLLHPSPLKTFANFLPPFSFLADLMDNSELIRNVTLCGHLHHGKVRELLATRDRISLRSCSFLQPSAS